MKNLQEILYNVRLQSVIGTTDKEISDLCIDSRKIKSNAVFIAIKGVKDDGHSYINKSIELGATVVVCENLPNEIVNNITYLQVQNSSIALANMSHDFFGQPSEKLNLVGITGTNGKTTIATLLFKLFSELGFKCGLISTVQNQINNTVLPSTHTTPDAIQFQSLLNQMVAEGCEYVFMECSSHAIHQNRIHATKFKGAVFSNITHDHLDYHETFNEYIKVKKSFFDVLSATSFSITNIDDKNGWLMLQNTKAQKYSYSLKNIADFKGKILENDFSGLVLLINEKEVHFRLIGEFNAYNLLAVYGTAICLNQNAEDVLRILSSLVGAEGRFDYVLSKKNIIGIVDYAHTPDALENVLSTIKKLRKGNEKVITVVGCGGDRDKTKRPLMAEIASELSDKVIFTSDNPRSENPEQILKDMEDGLNSSSRRKHLSIIDRKEAIKAAISLAEPEDIVLVAGKGHEKYQEINGVKHPFDDKKNLQDLFELLEK